MEPPIPFWPAITLFRCFPILPGFQTVPRPWISFFVFIYIVCVTFSWFLSGSRANFAQLTNVGTDFICGFYHRPWWAGLSSTGYDRV